MQERQCVTIPYRVAIQYQPHSLPELNECWTIPYLTPNLDLRYPVWGKIMLPTQGKCPFYNWILALLDRKPWTFAICYSRWAELTKAKCTPSLIAQENHRPIPTLHVCTINLIRSMEGSQSTQMCRSKVRASTRLEQGEYNKFGWGMVWG